MCCVRPFGQKIFSIVQKYEYDVNVSRTRTFVRGQRRTKVRKCGRTFNLRIIYFILYPATGVSILRFNNYNFFRRTECTIANSMS